MKIGGKKPLVTSFIDRSNISPSWLENTSIVGCFPFRRNITICSIPSTVCIERSSNVVCYGASHMETCDCSVTEGCDDALSPPMAICSSDGWIINNSNTGSFSHRLAFSQRIHHSLLAVVTLDVPQLVTPLTLESTTATVVVSMNVNELTIKNTTLLLSGKNVLTSTSHQFFYVKCLPKSSILVQFT